MKALVFRRYGGSGSMTVSCVSCAGEYAVLGSWRMDCIGRWESDRADWEIASQRHAT